MKPKIYFKDGWWRVSPKPKMKVGSGRPWLWDWAHKWVNKHNNYSYPELRRQSPWGLGGSV